MSRSRANRRGIRWSSYFPQRRIAPKETTVSQATAETITVGALGVRPRRRAFDLAIAATANVHGVPLPTYNTKDFQTLAEEIDVRTP
jgi:predicted nucleic acid-binding protein